MVDPPGVLMLTRSTLLSSTTSTSRRRLYCSLPLAGDRTDPDSGGTLAFTALRVCSLLGKDIRRWHQPRREFPTRITGGRLPRGAGTESRPSRSCGWNPWRWGGFAKANSAVSPQRSRHGRFARQVGNSPDTRTATAPAVSRNEATWKQFATNSRNSLLFGRSAVRALAAAAVRRSS